MARLDRAISIIKLFRVMARSGQAMTVLAARVGLSANWYYLGDNATDCRGAFPYRPTV